MYTACMAAGRLHVNTAGEILERGDVIAHSLPRTQHFRQIGIDVPKTISRVCGLVDSTP